MYQNYFGFRERPFQLVPNPAYLFLSHSHEEAMAHLTYAVSEGDGFIAIIGEVGTGKTTLCRAFIESLDDRREVAYVFNPKLNATELLETVCDEFDIPVPDDGTTKRLIDALNNFFLEKKAEGKQVMLIIDEAQNLKREVLEQLRLLSNLETNTEKLLQIVLVGQPELDDLLSNFELRQLSQRITLRCHLSALTFDESMEYIRHRIRIAARNQGVAFTPSAFRKIYAFSGGIPRMIHIICDRALLAAYVRNQEKITGPIVRSAIKELNPRGTIHRLGIIEKRKTVLLSALLCLLLVMLFIVKPKDPDITPTADVTRTYKLPVAPQEMTPPASPSASGIETTTPSEPSDNPMAEKSPEIAEAVIAPPDQAQPTPPRIAAPPVVQLEEFLSGIDNAESKKKALSGALALWGTTLPIREYTEKKLIDPETYFNLTARRNGFLIQRMQTRRTDLYKLNLPVIFEFTLNDPTEPYFLTLSRMKGQSLTFLVDATGEEVETSAVDVDEHWTGWVYIPWTNFSEYEGVTPISGGKRGIQTLKQILHKIGYDHLSSDPVYDPETESVIREIQFAHNIPVDGLVGPLTKMVLYNKIKELDIPHIRENSDSSRPTEPGVGN